MSELQKHFERLMKFAKQNNFHKPFSQVYFVEEKSVRRSLDLNRQNEISQQDIFAFVEYEKRFDEILNQGHSWINMNFAGMLNDNLLIVIETPNYKNNTPKEFVAVNLSGPIVRIQENNGDAAPFYRIIE